jgi:hypothetical protein
MGKANNGATWTGNCDDDRSLRTSGTSTTPNNSNNTAVAFSAAPDIRSRRSRAPVATKRKPGGRSPIATKRIDSRKRSPVT